MNQTLLYILIGLSFIQSIFIIIMLVKNGRRNNDELAHSERRLRDDINRLLEFQRDSDRHTREENAGMARLNQEAMLNTQAKIMNLTTQSIENLRATVEQKLTALQAENASKLDQMRGVVDEKLNTTLQTRLGESFKLVSERLEQVYKGLGEMQTLASGVGDLKKVLTNIKTRGTWGEIQLGNLLEQMLSPQQYAKNIATVPLSAERVEYAVILPGQSDGNPVYLPIDAKFPQEDYIRLCDASEKGDIAATEAAQKLLYERIRLEARRISEKYIEPPYTTDFGIMYLPVEGLYAEVARQAELSELIQRQYRVVIAGPSTLTALLNSLQMGFATLSIQKRSSEVWQLLGVFKSEFNRFDELLTKTKKKLQEAAGTIEKAEIRTRSIHRKLREVEQIAVPDEEYMDKTAIELTEDEEEMLS